VNIRTRAKINLFLEVLDKRPDGYHELDTVFQSISLSDELLIDRKDKGFSLTVNDPTVPTGRENLIYKVYDLLKRRFPRKVGGICIRLEKNIPTGAGLGGGSADAAAAMMIMNTVFHLNLDEKDLHALSLEIGMDVPFCLTGGSALAGARGEKLTPIRRLLDFQVLVVYPGFPVMTGTAYDSLDQKKERERRNSRLVVSALQGKNVDELYPLLYNCFEEVLLDSYPVLKEIKTDLVKGGCGAALISGSGSAVCGYAHQGMDLQELKSRMKARYPFVVLTRPVDTGVVLLNNAE
jgi:4-diphosphocytidyl-2-C-methyl-D-erythritol kinase